MITSTQAIQFFNNLTLTGDYSYQSWKLREWQEDILRQIYDNTNNGKRVVKNVMLLIPRKNAKTQLAAGLVLLHLFCGEPGQCIVSAGGSREQAARVFEMASQMVESDPYLASIASIHKSTKRITIDSKHSVYLCLSNHSGNAHGYNPSVVIADEIHSWSGGKGKDLWAALTSGFGTRKQPLTIAITTQPANRYHFSWEEVEYAKQVQSGDIDNPNYLPILYYSDIEDDWTSEKLWHKCNPALGDFLELDFLRTEFAIAQELPSKEASFRQLYLNQPVEESAKWMSLDTWDKCNAPIDAKELEGMECIGGLDLAPVKDLSCFTMLFDCNGMYKVLNFTWCCSDDILARSKRDKAPYKQWQDAGILRTMQGGSTDFDVIRRDINQLADKYRIKTIAADQFNCYQLGQQLTGDGIDVQWFRQGFLSMSPPTQRLEKLIIDKQIQSDCPILRWCVGNTVVERDAMDNIKPSKKRSTEKIDAVVALVMAIGISMHEPQSTKSVYESRGIFSL